jgi:NADH pyrophosphatase NudC (nudix superfamily)
MDEYISREETLKAFRLTAKNSNKDYQRGLQDAIDCLVPEVIAGIPSSDVQSVKRGRWICEFYNDVFDVYQADCSVCKRESTDKYNKVSESYEYCPHCGARMDLKDGDTNG